MRYQTLEFGDLDIHLRTLRDNQQYSDDFQIAEKLGISSATWPLFGVVWESGIVLARLMFAYQVTGLKILEVGCGIGLTSLVLSHRLADITATDQHPEAGAFLKENVALNYVDPIPFLRAGWDEEETHLGQFDLIVGSDLLYERSNVGLLSEFINKHAKPSCEVIIVDPGRGNQGHFSRKMLELGYPRIDDAPTDIELPESFSGHILHYARQ